MGNRHLEGASGMLGIVKAILMVKSGIILPTAGFEKMNPKIKGQEKMRVVQSLTPWPEKEQRRVLVTNFGMKATHTALQGEREGGVNVTYTRPVYIDELT